MAPKKRGGVTGEMTTEYLLNKEVGHVLAALMPQNRLIVQVILHNGARIGDVLRLRTEQLKPSFWYVEQKTGKRRRMGIPEPLLSAIKRQAGREWAFPGRDPENPSSSVGRHEAGTAGFQAAAEHRDAQRPESLRRGAHAEVWGH